MEKNLAHMLLGRDLRRIKGSNEVARVVQDQQRFDELFALLLHHERPLVMRSADAIEKITRHHPQFLFPHHAQIISLMHGSVNIELKWHIAQLLPRLRLTRTELKEVWGTLTYWTRNPNESKIVRVNALQGLFELAQKHSALKKDFIATMNSLDHELIPSLTARVKKLKKLSDLPV